MSKFMTWYFAVLVLPFVPLLVLMWLDIRHVSWAIATLTMCAAISAYCMHRLLDVVTDQTSGANK